MRWALFFFALVTAGVLQVVTPPWRMLGSAKVPFMAGVVMFVALTRPPRDGVGVACAGGLLMDALGMTPLGVSSLALCLAALAWGHSRHRVFARKGLTHVVMGAVGCGGMTLLLGILLTAAGDLAMTGGAVVAKAAGTALLGAWTAPLVFYVLMTAERTLGLPETPRGGGGA